MTELDPVMQMLTATARLSPHVSRPRTVLVSPSGVFPTASPGEEKVTAKDCTNAKYPDRTECYSRRGAAIRCFYGQTCVYKDTVHSDSVYSHCISP